MGIAGALARPPLHPSSNAPSRLVAAVVFAFSRLHEGFDLRAVEVRSHPLAIAPVELANALSAVSMNRKYFGVW